MNEFLELSAEERSQVAGGSVAGNLVVAVNGAATALDQGVVFFKPPKHTSVGRFTLDVAGHNVGYLE